MNRIAVAIASLGLVTLPAHARDADRAKGVAVIGVKGEIAPTLAWRQFDPSTGKLLPFVLVKNMGKGAKTALSNLFGGLGRLGKADKRYARNDAGVSYRMAELPPGTYILEAINGGGFRSVFGGNVPVVRISAGRAVYAGDFAVEIDKDNGGRAVAAGRTLTGAQIFLTAFAKANVLADAGSGTATLDCVGKLVPFADQLVCDADRSRVGNVVIPDSDK